MANEGDLGNEAAQLFLDATLRNKRLEMAANCAKASTDTCVECGGEISKERQQAQPGCDMCVPCLDMQERRDGLTA